MAGTPFDFSEAHRIGDAIAQVPGGYDHNYVLFGMGRQAKFIVKSGAASNTCARNCGDGCPGPAAAFRWVPAPCLLLLEECSCSPAVVYGIKEETNGTCSSRLGLMGWCDRL